MEFKIKIDTWFPVLIEAHRDNFHKIFHKILQNSGSIARASESIKMTLDSLEYPKNQEKSNEKP